MAHNNDKTLSIIEQVFKTMPQLLDERHLPGAVKGIPAYRRHSAASA